MRLLPVPLVVALTIGCTGVDRPEQQVDDPRTAFRNLIDHQGSPDGAEDWTIMPFADQGAWFGLALPGDDAPRSRPGFGGPFLMTTGRWVGPGIADLDLPGAELVGSTSLPGALETRWRTDSLEITQTLWFDSSRVALIRTELVNQGAETWTWTPEWVGVAFDGAASVAATDTGVLIRSPNGDRVRVVAGGLDASVLVDAGRCFTISSDHEVTVDPGGSAALFHAVTMTTGGDAEPDHATALVDADDSLARNAARWNGYVSTTSTVGVSDEPARIVAVKAIQTLIGNWRGPAGRFDHGGLFPSSNVWYFNGFWAWDSWKHAVALARFAPDVAADQLRLMAAQQDASGMIADVVYLDPAEDNWRNSKPPLLGWALEEVYYVTGDLELVREIYPRLVRYHEFWSVHRDHDGDGLSEYGSTDGTIEAARWESGMDNAVRFDGTHMLENGPGAWSMNQESVDLASYLYREKLALERLASAVGESDDSARWAAEARTLGESIRSTMWDEATGWFYDTTIDTGEPIRVRGPEGWIPLWAGVATPEQAARARETMLDPAVFRTHVPFPTVAADHPEFSDGYWRGLVWLDQAYFAIEGLRAYGYTEDADALTHQLLANIEGAVVPGSPLHENYHPLTGEGRNVRHFSWTAAHLLLLMLERP